MKTAMHWKTRKSSAAPVQWQQRKVCRAVAAGGRRRQRRRQPQSELRESIDDECPLRRMPGRRPPPSRAARRAAATNTGWRAPLQAPRPALRTWIPLHCRPGPAAAAPAPPCCTWLGDGLVVHVARPAELPSPGANYAAMGCRGGHATDRRGAEALARFCATCCWPVSRAWSASLLASGSRKQITGSTGAQGA